MVLLAARFISEQPTIRDLLQNQGTQQTSNKRKPDEDEDFGDKSKRRQTEKKNKL